MTKARNLADFISDATVATAEIADGAVTSAKITIDNDLNFPDNEKAIFGAGSDLQIYHTGTNSVIDNNTGHIYIRNNVDNDDGSNIYIQGKSGENSIVINDDSNVELYFDNALKLATTTTGVNITGTLTSDGLTVDGALDVNHNIITQTANSPRIDIIEADVTDKNTRLWQTVGQLRIYSISDDTTTYSERIRLDHATGDISFYEDTGSTAKFFWDASAESLGIGTSSPATALDVLSGSASVGALKATNASGASASTPILEAVNGGGNTRLIVLNDGKVGISTDSPSALLHVESADGTAGGAIKYTSSGVASGYMSADAAGLCLATDTAGITFRTGITSNDPTDTGTERMRIDNSGNIGIGTTDTSFVNGIGLKIANATSARFSLCDSSNGVGSTDGFQFTAAGLDGYIYNQEAGSIIFGTSAAERMRIDSSGNVGIKTSASGGVTLDVAGTIRSTVSGGTAVMYLNNGATQNSITNTSGSLTFALGASEAMRIDSSGRVGIGTISPATSISGSAKGLAIQHSNVAYISLDNTGSSGRRYTTYSNTGGSLVTYDEDAASARMIIDSSGMLNANYGISVDGGTIKLDGNYPVGTGNVALGDTALDSLTSGTINTAVGNVALTANTTGYGNAAFGDRALTANIGGLYNTAVGTISLSANTSGSNNVAVGGFSLDANTTSSNNTAVGFAALSANTTASNNTALGYQALYDNTTGASNTGIGSYALTNVTTGANNTALGKDAALNTTTANANVAVGRATLYTNSTGASNTALGETALYSNTTASQNTAVGYQAGYTNTTGTRLSALGYKALLDNTTGGYLTGLGWGALVSNTTGSYNTAVGDSALLSNTTAGSNTAVGYKALFSNTGASYNTAVGHLAGEDNTTGVITALGHGALQNNTTGLYSTALGQSALALNTTGASNTAVGYSTLLANTTGSENSSVGMQAMDSNTTGSSNTALGYQSLQANTTASNNTAVGYKSLLSNTTGAEQVALGHTALEDNTTGTRNVAVGYGAVKNNTTGDYNVGVGYAALVFNTTGSSNTALGKDALYNNATASANTSVGYQAGYSGTTGAGLTAMGYLAAFTSNADNNTAIGNQALKVTTSGQSNTAIGGLTLFDNTTGSYNVAVGRDALQSNTTASNNTAVGYQAGYSNTTGSNNTSLGHAAGYTMSSATYTTTVGFQAGYYAYADYNTFIGATAGKSITSGQKNTILGRYNGNQGGLDIRTSSNNIVLSDGDGNPRMYWHGGLTSPLWEINNSGGNGQWVARFNNTTNSGSPYGVNIRFTQVAPDNNNTQFITCNDSSTVRMLVTNQGDLQNHDNSYGAISDVKLKEQIEDASSQWQDIKDLTIRKYKMKTDIADKGDSNELWRLGVVAQEVETAGMSGLVYETPDRDEDNNDLGTTTKAVKYSILYMKAVKALQEAMDRIETLEAKVSALEGN